MSLAFLTFSVFGLALSFESNKSEAVPIGSGPNSKASRRSLSEQDNSCSFYVGGSSFVLRFVESYKHLGCNFTVSNDMKLEVVCKSGYIRSSVNSIRRVICNPHVSLKKKLTCIQAHLLAGGLNISGTWSHIPSNAYAKLFHSILHAYRVATKNVYNPAMVQRIFSDAELIEEFGLIAPMSMIRANRMSLFYRIVRKAPPLLIDLMRSMYDVKYGWIDCLKTDLARLSLSGYLPVDFGSLPALESNILAGFPLAKIAKQFSACSFANIIVPRTLPQFAEPVQIPSLCPDCGLQFVSLQ